MLARALIFFLILLFVTIFQVQCLFTVSFNQQADDFMCTDEDGFFGVPGTCQGLYYACFAGITIEQRCPGDEVFDPEILRCVSYDVASCRDMTTTTTQVTITTSRIVSTTASEGPCSSGDGFYPLPNYCGSNYIICIGGSSYNATCPGNAIFDPEQLVCVSQEDASCTPGGFQCPATDGAYPYPGDCTRYIVCKNGEVASTGTCSPPLVFNPANHFCDYPSNVPSCQ